MYKIGFCVLYLIKVSPLLARGNNGYAAPPWARVGYRYMVEVKISWRPDKLVIVIAVAIG